MCLFSPQSTETKRDAATGSATNGCLAFDRGLALDGRLAFDSGLATANGSQRICWHLEDTIPQYNFYHCYVLLERHAKKEKDDLTPVTVCS